MLEIHSRRMSVGAYSSQVRTHRRRRPAHRPVVHGLDVGAVRVEYVGGVVAGVVLALARCAVVPTTRRDGRLVEAGDRLRVGRLEGDMEPDSWVGRRR